jgi:hypothetical protein
MTEFLLVCVPSERELPGLGVDGRYEDSPALVGGSRESPKFTLLRNGSASVQLVWPPADKSNGGTVVLYPGDQKGQMVVPSEANGRAIGNGQNSDMLLFLEEPPDGEKLLVARNGGKSRRFERGEIEPGWFPMPHGLWTKRCPLFTRSFASVGGTAKTGYTPLTLAVASRVARENPVAVLNPVIFRVALAGDDFPHAGGTAPGGVTFESALHELIVASRAPGGVLLVEPVISADNDARIRAFDAIAQGVKARKERSVVEELLLSRGGDDDWLPFLCLDLLGGRFRLDHPASARDGKWMFWGFRPDEPDRRNAAWFASHWVKRWGGRYEPVGKSEPVIVLPLDEENPGDKEKFRETNLKLTRGDSDTAYADCREFLTRLAPDGFLSWVLDERKQFALTTQHQKYFDRGKAKGGRYPISCKREGLLQALAEELLFPRSPVLVQPPPAATIPDPAHRAEYERVLGGSWFDLQRSVRWFARDFGLKLTAATPGTSKPIPWKDNWWGEWYDLLFRPGAGPDFGFEADDSGFVIGTSFVGRDDVLGYRPGYEQGELIVL